VAEFRDRRRLIGNFSDLPEVLRFVNSREAKELAHLGTSCPDHFHPNKVRPLFVPWQAGSNVENLKRQIDSALETYRKEYAELLQIICAAGLARDARCQSHSCTNSGYRNV